MKSRAIGALVKLFRIFFRKMEKWQRPTHLNNFFAYFLTNFMVLNNLLNMLHKYKLSFNWYFCWRKWQLTTNKRWINVNQWLYTVIDPNITLFFLTVLVTVFVLVIVSWLHSSNIFSLHWSLDIDVIFYDLLRFYSYFYQNLNKILSYFIDFLLFLFK